MSAVENARPFRGGKHIAGLDAVLHRILSASSCTNFDANSALMKFLPLAFVAAFIAIAPLRAEPAAPPPELKILEQLVGKWHVEAIAHKTEWNAEERKITGDDSGAWTLGGRFLEWHGADSDKNTSLGLYTYDAQQRCYRHWWFGSGGFWNETTGQWDAATKTLTWKGTLPNGLAIAATYHFPSDGISEADVKVTDAGGNIYYYMTARGVRQ